MSSNVSAVSAENFLETNPVPTSFAKEKSAAQPMARPRKFMDPTYLALDVTSPDDLEAKLAGAIGSHPGQYRYAALAVRHPEIVVYPFNIKRVPAKEIHKLLGAEAVELLSLPVDQIEIDFQILNSTEDKVSGVFVCAPRELLQQLLTVVEKYKLYPVKITARLLSSLDSFYRLRPSADGRFCCLEFLPQHVHLAVFNNRQAEFVRDIGYETLEEAKQEIVQSLRSASSKSAVKTLDHLYYAAAETAEDQMVMDLEKMFNTRIAKDSFGKAEHALTRTDNFFTLNLLKNYVVSLQERDKIYKITNAVLAAAALAVLLLGFQVFRTGKIVRETKSSYQSSDVMAAKELQQLLSKL